MLFIDLLDQLTEQNRQDDPNLSRYINRINIFPSSSGSVF